MILNITERLKELMPQSRSGREPEVIDVIGTAAVGLGAVGLTATIFGSLIRGNRDPNMVMAQGATAITGAIALGTTLAVDRIVEVGVVETAKSALPLFPEA